jgi:hypothetical protein
VYIVGNQGASLPRNAIITKYDAAGAATVFSSGSEVENASDLAFDTAGNLYVTNESQTLLKQDTIVKFAADGTHSVFATGLSGPHGLAFDGTGNLYVAEQFNNRVLKFTPAGASSVFANVNQPKGLAFDGDGNVYVASQNGTIMKFAPDGIGAVFVTQIQNGGVQVYPFGIAFDKAGNLYAACYNTAVDGVDAIMKFTPNGATSGYVTEGLINPYHLAFDNEGNLFISNFGQFGSTGKPVNSSITKVTPNGAVSTFAGPLTVNAMGIAIWPGSLPVKPPAPPTAKLLNISTRLRVQSGENVLIGGFIVTGNTAKKVMLRAIGPSLANAGITSFLPHPTLELRDANATLMASNDNWKINDQTQQSQEAEIRATTIPPSNDLESALVATLNPNQGYTAIVRGKDNTPGIAVVEAYDLDQTADSILANISTRGFVDTNSNVMIGGLILGGGNGKGKVVVRAIGPSLSQSAVGNPLGDPLLELYDANGIKQAANDNWKINDQSGQSQETDIRATTVPPFNDLESAILITLPAGSYTAIVSGNGGGTGVGLVEAYNLK